MVLLRPIVILCLLAVPPAIGTAIWHRSWTALRPADLRPHEVAMAAVRGWTARVLWIDARSEAEYRVRHVPSALRLTNADWDRQVTAVLDAWRPGTRIVVYCGGGNCAASEDIARRLRGELGLPDVYFLHGGLESWLRARN